PPPAGGGGGPGDLGVGRPAAADAAEDHAGHRPDRRQLFALGMGGDEVDPPPLLGGQAVHRGDDLVEVVEARIEEAHGRAPRSTSSARLHRRLTSEGWRLVLIAHSSSARSSAHSSSPPSSSGERSEPISPVSWARAKAAAKGVWSGVWPMRLPAWRSSAANHSAMPRASRWRGWRWARRDITASPRWRTWSMVPPASTACPTATATSSAS